MTTHLIREPGRSLNSRKKKIKCKTNWYCKRMTCNRCFYHRRDFFIERGEIFAKDKNLSKLVTVSWLDQEHCDSWLRLTSLTGRLAKALSGVKAGPFIRVISLGKKKQTPHIHYFVGKLTAKIIYNVVHRKWSRNVLVQIKNVYEPKKLLGYFYDQNFEPSCMDPNRIKGIRLISASRPMITGFPTKTHTSELRRLQK